MAKSIPRAGLAALAALCVLAAGRARADDPIEYTEAYSTEVAVLNSAPALVFTEAVSREAVLYNTEPALLYGEAVSREAALYNSEQVVITQAYSTEASLYNSEPALAYREAFSREAVSYVSEISIVDSFSREAAVYNGYYLPEAMDAIRIAGGFQTATPTQMNRFQLALQMTAQNRVTLPVAAAILRIAIRLQ